MSPRHRLSPDASEPAAADPRAPEPAAARPDPAGDGGVSAWERVPPRGPVLRWRPALLAVTVLLVAAAAWWAVTWLTAPAPPVPAAGLAAAPPTGEEGPASDGDAPSEDAASVPADAAGGAPSASAVPPGPEGSGAEATPLRVHVVGEVERPGVVSLAPGARVADAVRAAGGPTRDARTERINLAAPLGDGQQVLVPSTRTPDEDLARAAGAAGGTGSEDPGPSAGTASRGSAPHGSTSAGTGPGGGGAVDLNSADAVVLQTLPGVGPATAEKIIAHREVVGPFTGLQDLDAVPGVGPATLERLRDRVTW